MARTDERDQRASGAGAVHPVDEVLPVPKLAVYGFQHVLAFYAGAVIVPILLASAIDLTPEQLAYLINADLFTCGIASIIQSVGFWKIGVRMPLLQGVTFAAVSPMISHRPGRGRRRARPAGHLRLGDHRRGLRVPGRAVLRQAHPAVPADRHRHRHHHHRHRPAVGGRPGRRRRRGQPVHRPAHLRGPAEPGPGRLHAAGHPGHLPDVHRLPGHRGRAHRPGRRHPGRLAVRLHRLQPGRRGRRARGHHPLLLRDADLQRGRGHLDGHRHADHHGRDHRRRVRLRRDRGEAGGQGGRGPGPAGRRPGHLPGRDPQLVPLHLLRRERRAGPADQGQEPLGGGHRRAVHDPHRPGPQGRGDRRRHPAAGARRGRDRPVRHRGRGRRSRPCAGSTSTTSAT